MLNMQRITPNSKRWDYLDIPGGGTENIKNPSTRLKVTTTLEKTPTPTYVLHLSMLCYIKSTPMWAHAMMTSPNENIFRVTGPLWGNPSVAGGFPSQWPVKRSFNCSKQSRSWWFETPSHTLWRHCNAHFGIHWQQRKHCYPFMFANMQRRLAIMNETNSVCHLSKTCRKRDLYLIR